MSYTIDSARTIFPETQLSDRVPATIESFNRLSAEDRLALLWFAYTEMGVTITPAAMFAVNMVFAENTLTQIKQMSFVEQTQVMCDLVNHSDTPICHTYSSFGTNVKLGFWYQLSEWMKQEIIAPIPEHYKLSAKASEVLQAIRQLEGGEQLTVLQNIVAKMGYAPTDGTPLKNYVSRYRIMSKETTRRIDLEVTEILETSHHHALNALKQNRDLLETIATLLLETEAIEEWQTISAR